MRTYEQLRAAGVPEGYATRMVLSHHKGGWMPCKGLPTCKDCRRQESRGGKARQEARGAQNAPGSTQTPANPEYAPASFLGAQDG